jgi:hypothetical protein
MRRCACCLGVSLLSLAVLLLGCSRAHTDEHDVGSAATPKSPIWFDHVVLKRLPAGEENHSPAYNLTINSNGDCEFEGVLNVDLLGVRPFVIDQHGLSAIAALMLPWKCGLLQRHYGFPVAHLQLTTLTITANHLDRTYSYYGVRGELPPFASVGKEMPEDVRGFWIFLYAAIAAVEAYCGIEQYVGVR